MLVSFFSLMGLTSISSERAFSPTIIPSYTSTPGPTSIWPRSCRLNSANVLVVAAPVGHEAAGRTRAQLAEPRLVAVEHVVEHAGAAGLGHELGAEPDEPTGGHEVLHAHPAGAVVHHLLHAALAQREQLGDHAEVVLGHVDRHPLHRLVDLAVDLAGDHLRLADGELEALATHRLDEHRELQLAAALHLPRVGAVGVEHADRHVADQLGVEAVLHQPGGELVAVLARRAATC